MAVFKIIDKLYEENEISYQDCVKLLNEYKNKKVREYLFEKSNNATKKAFNNEIYIRGLIEFSNYCKNDCYYCGIRKSNTSVLRYRLTKEEILLSCENGYKLGFRTFVLQSGEDGYFSDDIMCDIVSEIRKKYPDCAITLSIGERSYDSYKRLYECGADRYLLREESINPLHYKKLHPENLSIEKRVECLHNLKEIGYQVGLGFMVGSPYQTLENIAEDIMFIKDFKPQMIGIGPFISQKDTPFSRFKNGDYKLCVFIIGILRLLDNNALIPATTALNSINKRGRMEGILAGANVIMPNLSPFFARDNYNIYDKKKSTGIEGAESIVKLKEELKKSGYIISCKRGDYIK